MTSAPSEAQPRHGRAHGQAGAGRPPNVGKPSRFLQSRPAGKWSKLDQYPQAQMGPQGRNYAVRKVRRSCRTRAPSEFRANLARKGSGLPVLVQVRPKPRPLSDGASYALGLPCAEAGENPNREDDASDAEHDCRANLQRPRQICHCFLALGHLYPNAISSCYKAKSNHKQEN